MSSPHTSSRLVLAAGLVILGGAKLLAAPICKPDLSFRDVRLSALQELARKWTATLEVDATRCAMTHGRFEIDFVREKESAKELQFAEQFTWQTGPSRAGRIEVAVDFWIDEAVRHYSVSYVAPCGCRSDSARLRDQE